MISKVTPYGRNYREYSNYTDKPLLIYLHGAGERGTNPAIIDNVPFAKLFVPANKDLFTILAPQQTTNFWGWQGQPNTTHDAVEFIEWATTNYSHDGRVYVTGHSMGGRGTWEVAYIMKDKITAFVVSAGDSTNYQETVALGKLKLPGRAYHGDSDASVKYSAGVQACNWYKTGSGLDILITYSGEGHGIDGMVYSTADLSAWFLSHGVSTQPPIDEEGIIIRRGTKVIAKFGNNEIEL